MDPKQQCLHDHADFYSHPFVQSIANEEKWTVSTRDKIPVDIFVLQTEHRLSGALFRNELSLTTLQNTLDIFGYPANHAYYLDAIEADWVMLDIEPTCPETLKQRFLTLPYIYGEISMSGRGIHLVFPMPSCIRQYPIAQKKPALKDSHGFYEILMNHYVTFTRNMLPPARPSDSKAFETLFEDLCKSQTSLEKSDIEFNSEEKPEIPYEEKFLSFLQRNNFHKTPQDFDNDMSRYEYSRAWSLCAQTKQLIQAYPFDQETYTPNMRVWLIYESLVNILPYREKHDSLRNGMPWLMYIAHEAVAKFDMRQK